jgi:hypothetical protein
MKNEEEYHEEPAVENLVEQKDIIVDEVKRITRSLNIKSEFVEKIVESLINNLPEMVKIANLGVDTKQISEFILLAKNDIYLANDAYRNNDFNNTLFHLQQSIEKVVKAYGMRLGTIENPRAEVGHNTPLVYLKLLEKTSELNNIPKSFGIKTDIKKAAYDFKALIANDKAKIEFDKSAPVFLNAFKDVLKQFDRKTSKIEIRKILREVKNIYGIDILRLCKSQIYFSFFLCPFAIITSPYAIDPRYSREQKYKELNLIKHFLEIQRNLEDLIAYIEEEDIDSL